MTVLYAKFDLGFAEHPKIIGLSSEAFRALVESVLWSRQHLTDGFIDARVLASKGWAGVVEELTSNDPVNPSWVAVDGGYNIYGFADKQTTSDEIEELRQKRRDAANKRWQSKTDANVMQSECKPDAKAMPETETETETYKNLSESKSQTGMREDWQPTQKLLDWAIATVPGVDVEYQTQRFINYWLATGKRMKNWDATWRNWMLKQGKELTPAVADRGRADEWMKAKTWRPES